MSRKIYRLEVASSGEGMRLDQFLSGEIGDLSRGMIRRIIDLGGVHVAGRRVGRCSHAVKCGQQVEVYLDGRPLDIPELAEGDMLFHDPYLLAVNKPAGMEFQPTHARFKGTVYETVLRYLREKGAAGASTSLGMVQRLDRDTSGIAIFSIHPRSHAGLTAIFAERRVRKGYLALVAGHPPGPAGQFRSLLARQHRTNRMKSVEKGGREAITRYRVIEEFDGASLVDIEIPTGRSHQIRVHFSEAGHPLLGDTAYKGPASLNNLSLPRQMLHAAALDLAHPVSGKALSIVAPLPDDMARLIAALKSDCLQGNKDSSRGCPG
jgi:23S rRNA pseudouridine1911/1915/1917 synthase